MSYSLDVKNYAIAFEALSRINHPLAHNAIEAIEDLLASSISLARKDQRDALVPPAQSSTNDDDIPF